MAVASWAAALKKLQDKDMRIGNLKIKLEVIPSEQQSLKKRAADNLGRIEKAKNDVIELQLQLKKTEKAINDCKENIRKLETQSVLVKKNNEYQAMLQSIEDQKLKISAKEDSIISLLDMIEDGKKKYKEIAENVKFENASLKAEFKDLEKLSVDIKTELDILNSERPALAAPIDAEILGRYENLLKRGNGEPLVKVVNGVCAHCHLKVTPQTINQAIKHEVVFCDNCQHFIYMED